MRYVIFPSLYYPDGTRPTISSIFQNTELDIVAGPTESGLYIVDAPVGEIEYLKLLAEPFYILFEDFESPMIH